MCTYITGNALVVSSAMDMEERLAIQILMTKILERYGSHSLPDQLNGPNVLPNSNPNLAPEYSDYNANEYSNNINNNYNNYEDPGDTLNKVEDMPPFHLFESYPRYGNLKNLMFDDSKY